MWTKDLIFLHIFLSLTQIPLYCYIKGLAFIPEIEILSRRCQTFTLFLSQQQSYNLSLKLEVYFFVSKFSYSISIWAEIQHQIYKSLKHSIFELIWHISSFPRFGFPLKALLSLIETQILLETLMESPLKYVQDVLHTASSAV